jgi:hypothetical protein
MKTLDLLLKVESIQKRIDGVTRRSNDRGTGEIAVGRCSTKDAIISIDESVICEVAALPARASSATGGSGTAP